MQLSPTLIITFPFLGSLFHHLKMTSERGAGNAISYLESSGSLVSGWSPTDQEARGIWVRDNWKRNEVVIIVPNSQIGAVHNLISPTNTNKGRSEISLLHSRLQCRHATLGVGCGSTTLKTAVQQTKVRQTMVAYHTEPTRVEIVCINMWTEAPATKNIQIS